MELGLQNSLGANLIPKTGASAPSFTASIAGLTTYPGFGPSAASGAVLTAQASGFSGAPPGSTTYQWSTIESGDLAGATAATFIPDANALDGETLFCSISPAGYSTRTTQGAIVRHVAPTAAGGIADLNLQVGQATTVSSVPLDFTGAALSFALAPGSSALPAGLTLGSDGVLSGTPGALTSGLSIVVDASNSGGSAQTGFSVSTFDVPDAFASSDWTLAPTGTPGELQMTIVTMPSANNAAVSAVEFRLDGGAWSDAGSTGVHTLTGLTGGQTYTLELRAINAAGASLPSDSKTAEPDQQAGPGDTVAPVVETASYDQHAREITLNITEATGSSTVFWALVANPSTPTAAQIEAGAGGGVIEGGSFQSSSGGDVDMISVSDESGDEIHLFARDAAGNDSGVSVIGGISVDNTAPVFLSASPAAGSTGIDPNTPISLTFSETLIGPVSTGAFNLYAQGALVESFDTATGAGDQGGSVSIVGADVTVTPGAALASGASVSVQWSAGAVRDHYGNPLAANTSDTLFSFETVSLATRSMTSLGIQNSGSAFGVVKDYTFTMQAGKTQYITVSGRFDSASISGVEIVGDGSAIARQALLKNGNYGAAIYAITAANSGAQTVRVTLSGGRNHIKCGVVETEGFAFARAMTATQQGGNNAGAGGGQLIANDTDTSLGEGVIAIAICSDASGSGFSDLNGYDATGFSEETNTADIIATSDSVAGGAPETFNLTYDVAFKASVVCGVVLN
jgi:hypothetical protein